MLLRQLAYFAAVVDEMSFTRAARRCFVSQSALSQQVKALEEELGCTLLDRRGRHFELTPAGEAAYAAARDVIARVGALRLSLEQLGDNARQELRFGYLARFGGWEISSAVAAFTLRHPQVGITARAGAHEELYELLVVGALDIVFSDRRRELSPAFANEHILSCYTVAEVSEASPLSTHAQIPISELGGVPCILVAGEEQRASERDYYRNVLNVPGPFLFADSLEEAHLMVASNRGFLPLEVRERTGATGQVIKRIPLVDATGPLRRDYYAFWPLARTSWATRELAAILRELLAAG